MKQIQLLLAFCLATTFCFAQESQTDLAKAKIREVKLSEQYLYAEGSSMTGADEAKSNSLDQLHAQLIGLYAESGKSKEDAEKAWEMAKEKCQEIGSQREELFKVFTYIPKSVVSGETTVDTQKNDSTPTSAQSNAPVLATPPVTNAPQQASDENIPSEDSFTMDEKTAALALEMITMVEAKPQKIAVVTADATPVIEEKAITEAKSAAEVKPVAEALPVVEAKPEPIQQPVPIVTPVAKEPVFKNPLESLPQYARNILEDMLAMETYKEVMTYLYNQKDQGRVIYGRIKTLTSPENSYLLITKDGKMETILNKGTGLRMNFKTNTPSSIKNYIGCGVIWFQIF